MKKVFLVLMAAVLIAGMTYSVCQADLSGSATASVFATVNPNVAIKANTPIVDAGSVQTGDFSATIIYRVDANMQFVNMFAEASQLYKGDDPTNPTVAPIPLNLSEGVLIDPTDANPINAGSNVADFVGAGAPIGDYPTAMTKTIRYESSQNNHFSQDVRVVVMWSQDDPEKPMGQYSGKVRLTALVIP